MLILTRRVGETLMIGDQVSVTVLGVKGNQVRIGVNAPKEVSVHREEIPSFVDMNISVKNMCQLLNMNYIKFNDSLLDDLKRRLSIIEEAQNKLLKIIDDLYEKEVKSKL